MSIPDPAPRKARGVSLVELIVFIVVVSVAVAGVLAALDLSTRASASPLIQKQALAIAEAMLEEVQLMPFTWCDPDDPAAPTATGPGGCATPEAPGAEGGESRTDPANPFDNVNDYAGLDVTGITDITGTAIADLGQYRMRVAVAAPAAGQTLGTIDPAETLLITVTVDGPANTTVVLQGYRARYAPSATP